MSTTKTRERLKDLAMEAYLEWRVVCSLSMRPTNAGTAGRVTRRRLR
jgi:hypothetical protein